MNEEYPTTDAEEIKARLDKLEKAVASTHLRLDTQAGGINAIGENMQWLVQNVQGIFQMFASPAFMSQMTNALMGGMNSGGQPGPAGSAAESSEGTDAGGAGNRILGEVHGSS